MFNLRLVQVQFLKSNPQIRLEKKTFQKCSQRVRSQYFVFLDTRNQPLVRDII